MHCDDFLPNTRVEQLSFRLWPGRCTLCRQASDLPLDLCSVCLDDLPFNGAACQRCALPLGHDTTVCGECLVKSPPFARVHAALRYEQDAQTLVTRLKFERNLVAGRLLARLVAGTLQRTYGDTPLPERLLPVPLSATRLLRRGHNQAAVIARALHRELGIPVLHDAVRRIRHTAPQTGQTRAARLRNLRGAFAIRRQPPLVPIAIVDDVMTTGTTVRTVARLLLAAGVPEVHVWVAARTPSLP